MKIKISEVWNNEGRSEELAIIETEGNSPAMAYRAVRGWIEKHRPELDMAETIYSHGFHAQEVR